MRKLDGRGDDIYQIPKSDLDVILDALQCGSRDLRDAAKQLTKSGIEENSEEERLRNNFNKRADSMDELYDAVC